MKLLTQSGSEDCSASKGVNPFFGNAEKETSVILHWVREKFGYSHYRRAEQNGVDRPYLHRIENVIQANPSRTTFVKIARELVRLSVGVLEGHRFLVAAGGLPIFLFARVLSSARVKKTDTRYRTPTAHQSHVVARQ